MKPRTLNPNARWDLSHNPDARPLGCNGKYGNSGRQAHRRRGETPCHACRATYDHYRREKRRGQPHPRQLNPCGTRAAAARHRAKGERLDFHCRLAETQYNQQQRTAKKAASLVKGTL